MTTLEVRTPPADTPAESFTVGDLRNLFTEYKNVLMGLRVQSRKLGADGISLGLSRTSLGLSRCVEDMYRKLSAYQDSVFLMEVGDAALEKLVESLADDQAAAEMADFRYRLAHIRYLLASLGTYLEEPARGRIEVVPTTIDANAEGRRANRQLLAYEIVLGRSRLETAPLRHNLDVMSRCNLRCLTCHQSMNQHVIHFDLADSPLNVLIPAIDVADEVNITGIGETLLSRAAPEIVTAYKRAGTNVMLQTNGTAFPRLQALAGAVDSIWVSIDGGTAASYDSIRRGGDFDKLVTRLAQLPAAYRRKISINFVVCKQNVFTAEACLKLAAELGFGEVHFQQMMAYLPWHDRMQIDDDDRAYFRENCPRWREEAASAGVRSWCNLTEPSSFPQKRPRFRLVDTTTDRIADIAKVSLPELPPKLGLPQILAELRSGGA